MNILFIVPYPQGKAASQRFRFEQYFNALRNTGAQFTVSSFFDNETWNIIYKPGHYFQKLWGLFKGYFRRIKDMFSIHNYDFIFIHREESPFGWPVFAWIITHVFHKKIIYDFDDAIWI